MLFAKRDASSPQNSANCSVVAAVGSLVLPMTYARDLLELQYQRKLWSGIHYRYWAAVKDHYSFFVSSMYCKRKYDDILISHIIMRIDQRVCPLHSSYVVDSICIL